MAGWGLLSLFAVVGNRATHVRAFGLASGTAEAHSQRNGKAEVDRWLGSYVEAWKTYDPDLIGALFADDIEYRYHPYDDPVVGRQAVIAAWVGESDAPGVSARDAPGAHDGNYAASAVGGDVAVATGVTTYYEAPGGSVDRVFHNCFVMRFDRDMRCTEFTE